MYILKCANGTFYVGSTKNLIRRIQEHETGNGANHTKRYGPVELVYFEIYQRIDFAYYREKQIQGWTRKKKQALIDGEYPNLKYAAKKIFRANSINLPVDWVVRCGGVYRRPHHLIAGFDTLRYSAWLITPWTEWSAVAECTEGHIFESFRIWLNILNPSLLIFLGQGWC